MRIVRGHMGGFRTKYPTETSEFDDSMGSAGEYRQLHQRVATDDLPRFEQEFKNYLNRTRSGTSRVLRSAQQTRAGDP